jgi:BirA family biotin operon repressor/biotin-[acetyl-CoA-carboxylase] ligase
MYHQVLQILADGQRHSAQQLIEQLTLNPSELEQTINTLTTFGVRLHSPAANTYQLAEPMELLERSRILAALPTDTLSRLATLEILDIVDSTNRYALEQHSRPVPFACLAEYQTAGRGRQGRQWISPYASGLCLSIKQRDSVLNESLAGLNIALAVTVARVLRSLGASEVGLKWPNDVCWRGRKLAGLLLESRHGKNGEIVIGIGINVKMPPLDTENITQAWVDLYTVLGRPVSRNTLAAMLIAQCLQTLILYPDVGLAAFRQDWQRFDLSYGRSVTLKIPPNPPLKITGTALGIDEQGALLLQVGTQKQSYVYGEVSLRL